LKEFANYEAYWELLADLANAGDVGKLALALPKESLTTQGERLPVRVTADAGAIATVLSGDGSTENVQLDKLIKLSIFTTGSFDAPKIQLEWQEAGGQRQSATLTALKGGNFKFRLSQSI
jgi:hypothetical protein